MMEENEHETREGGIKKSITGLGQQILGEIEALGGVITADPITQAEGEFNVEVGEIREDLEDAGTEENAPE